MQRKKIIKLVCVFVIIFALLFSCALSVSASSVSPPTYSLTSAQATIMAQSYNNKYQQQVDFPYRAFFFVNYQDYNGGKGVLISVCSADPFKFSQGELWKGRNQQVSVVQWTFYQPRDGYRVTTSYGDAVNNLRWLDGSGDSLGYQKLDIVMTAPSGNILPYNPSWSVFPMYAYNGIPSVWEYVVPPSTDMRVYEKPTDTKPQVILPWLDINSSLNSGGWIDKNGVVHGGGGGHFDIPETSSAEGDSYTNNVYGNAIADLTVIYNASPDDAQPITVTFWGHTYTLLDPNFFRSEAWDAARLLLQMCCIFILILWLRKKIYQVLDHAS